MRKAEQRESAASGPAGAVGQNARRLQMPAEPAHGRERLTAGKLAGARLAGLALGILLAVLVAAAGLALVWFDVSGSRQKGARLLKLDQASWVLLEERRAALDKATSELAVQKRQVEDDRLKNEGAAAALLKREKDLEQRLASLEEQTRQLGSRTLALQSLKSVYETMDPAKAAAMVAAAKDRTQTAVILKGISQARLSLILEQMAPATASEYMALMTPDLPAASSSAKP